MSLTQDAKIRQMTETTMVVGIDIASERHWARAFDWRGIELGKAFKFENDREGFRSLSGWIGGLAAKEGKNHVIVGVEPTGHYWFALAEYLRGSGAALVLVSPNNVKRAKELDDNHPSKNDRKDPKTIAKLVLEGRYNEPYIPEGVYAELRVAMNSRWRVVKQIAAVKNQIQRWLKVYFPEYKAAFGKFENLSSLLLLRSAPLPADIASLGVNGVNALWRKVKIRTVGMKRAVRICEYAATSVGIPGGEAARMDLRLLLEDYDAKLRQYEEIMRTAETLCGQIPAVAEMMKITGIGIVTAAGFLSETGDLRRFDSPRQIQKLAGLAITENSSGKHKGSTCISKRGRAKLRAILFRAAIVLAAKNPEFRSVHEYYTTRRENPLKKKQSIIAMCCKLIRVFYTVTVKGREYDGAKLLADMHRNTPTAA
ncbi:IS110 family transposase [Clostridia bacterium]|nr:IS110 family transposase [Clostridia bacterium]